MLTRSRKIGLFSTVCIVCSIIFLFMKNNTAEDRIGKFELPAMQGWKKNMYHSDVIERVTYTYNTKDTKIALIFTCFLDSRANKNLSAELKKEVERLEKYNTEMLAESGEKTNILKIEDISTHFGFAVLTTRESRIDNIIKIDKSAHFYYADKQYIMSSLVKSKAYSTKEMSIARNGWRKLWEESVPPIG